MNSVKQFFAIILISFILYLFLPWWAVAGAGFIAGFLIKNTAGFSFLSGLLGGGLLWLGMAFWIDAQTHSILTAKMNVLLPVSSMLLTTVVGALVGGLSTWSGNQMRSVASL